MTTVQLRLPDDLAKAAEQEGLLSPDSLAAMLRDALRRQAGRRLMEATAPAARGTAEMSEDEVSAFIHSVIADVRADKRTRDARSS